MPSTRLVSICCCREPRFHYHVASWAPTRVQVIGIHIWIPKSRWAWAMFFLCLMTICWGHFDSGPLNLVVKQILETWVSLVFTWVVYTINTFWFVGGKLHILDSLTQRAMVTFTTPVSKLAFAFRTCPTQAWLALHCLLMSSSVILITTNFALRLLSLPRAFTPVHVLQQEGCPHHWQHSSYRSMHRRYHQIQWLACLLIHLATMIPSLVTPKD